VPPEAAQQAGEARIAPELRVVEWQNEWIVRGSYPFTYQEPDAMLLELRARYQLDEVIAPARDELEQLLLLREWVHTRWRHGWTRTPPARNALDILRAAEGGSDFNCGYFAVTLMQCLLALGFVARSVSICKRATEWMAADEGNIGHSVVEAWSHQFHKWVVLDPDMNVHYERDGVPLGALEVHRAWVTRRWETVRMVQGPTPFRVTEKPESGATTTFRNSDDQKAELWIFGRHSVGDYYSHVRLPLRNTQHSSAGPDDVLRWIDEYTPPALVECNRPNAAHWTSDEADLCWTVDQVQIGLRADADAWQDGRAVLHVALAHSMPNLARLRVRLDDEPWRETPAGFRWVLKPGKNQIMAQGVNAFGREGHISRVLLRYHP
jgi:hypothetical protein